MKEEKKTWTAINVDKYETITWIYLTNQQNSNWNAFCNNGENIRYNEKKTYYHMITTLNDVIRLQNICDQSFELNSACFLRLFHN